MSSTTVAECNAFPIVRVALRIHALYDLPPELSRLDGKNEQLEVVVRPVVKYTHLERRITHLQLGERVFPFAVPAICFKGGRFVLDFDNVQAERGKSPDGSGGKTTHHRDVQRTVPELKDEGRNGILSETVSENSTLLEFPCPKGVKALICVMIGVRQRCAGISVVRWITGDLSTRTVAEGAGFFSVAAEEVYRKKTVPRIVGLSVGGVLCSVTVNPTDDREEVRERLESDRRRLFTAHNCEQLREVDIDSLLLSGFSEQDVYRRMLLLVDPEHYVRRLDELIELYSSNGASDLNRSAFLQGDPAAQEVELMRRAHIEVGPECCTVSARYRLLAFRKKYSLTDQNIIACLQPVVGDNINELLDVDPEVIFDALTKVFGREPRPTSYLFPARTYSPDRRTFLFDALRQSSSHHADKDAEPLLSASGKRAPLTVSPCERPLCWGSLTTSHGHPPGEVEILRAKYAPEFGLIVPVIAAALQLAVDRNGQLPLQEHPMLAALLSFLLISKVCCGRSHYRTSYGGRQSTRSYPLLHF
ncbi:hypothetical protein ERJ75_000425800 [Trypanosoma vivax]|nr:hypothetical protein ERJ75_000425800 [Trypanosoma vivax]